MVIKDAGGGLMSIVVLPSKGKSSDAGMTVPLSLKGAAEELDEKFAECLAAYKGGRTSLEEQIAATSAIIASATKSQAEKATKTLNEKSKVKSSASPAGEDNSKDDDDEVDDGNPGDSPVSGSNSATTAVSSEPGKTDLSTLL